MSVNMDAADAGTRTLASGPGAGRWAEPGFQLDSVSYITHDTSLSSAGDTQVSIARSTVGVPNCDIELHTNCAKY